MNNCDDEGYNKFPDEVLLNILSHLTHDNFLNVRLVNRQWNKVSYDVSLWRKVSFQAYFNMITIPENWKDQIWNAIIMISS
jgi:F-box-like